MNYNTEPLFFGQTFSFILYYYCITHSNNFIQKQIPTLVYYGELIVDKRQYNNTCLQ